MTDPCLRCLTGVDHDDHGACDFCIGLSAKHVSDIRNIRLRGLLRWIERAKQYLGAAYDNDVLNFTEGPGFFKGPQ